MTFTFLGTGTSQGIPVIGCHCDVCTSSDTKNKRLRCAALIQKGKHQFLIDAGPDIRQQALRSGVQTVEGVLITHEHYDHIGGLDDLRPIGFTQGGVSLYTQQDVQQTIRSKFDYAFTEQKYPGAPKFFLNEVIVQKELKIKNLQILPIRILHGHLEIVGYIIDKKLAYITDANAIPQVTIASLAGIHTLVINALHHKPHHSHFTLSQTLDIIAKIAPKTTYIIHMSHYMGLHDSIQSALPDQVHLAYDMLSIEI